MDRQVHDPDGSPRWLGELLLAIPAMFIVLAATVFGLIYLLH